MGLTGNPPQVGSFDINELDRDYFKEDSNPEGHVVIEMTHAQRWVGRVPDNMFEGHTRQEFDRTIEHDSMDPLHFCLCGEFLGAGDDGRKAANDHLREAQGTVSD